MTQQPPTRKSPKAAAAAHLSYKPGEYGLADAHALRALQAGTADAAQQKRALAWIMNEASKYLDEPYRPGGQDGDRDTVFALGRAFVGRQIAKLLNLNLSKLRGEESEHG